MTITIVVDSSPHRCGECGWETAYEYGRNEGLDPDVYPAGELCTKKFYELRAKEGS